MTGPRPKTPSKDPLPNNTAPKSFLGRSIFVAALSIGAFFILGRFYDYGPKSDAYALCSPDGTANIYTVDTINSRVQCIVVHNAVIKHTGSLGKFELFDVVAAPLI